LQGTPGAPTGKLLDLRTIREDADTIGRRLGTKVADADVTGVLTADRRRRDLIAEVESLKNQRNVASRELGRKKKEGGENTSGDQATLRELGDRIKDLDQEVREVDVTLHDALLGLPNLPHESVPVGSGEVDNLHVRTHGTQRKTDFEPKPHWEVGEALGILDFERAARMSGSGFAMLMGDGARLQRALIRFMLDVHTREHGYREVAPPYLVNDAAMTGTGQLPKMAEDMYRSDEDGLWLIPTAEVPVTNFYREEVIEDPLPVYLTAHTPCFRREAGAAGRDTRGMIRVHQFEKVELVKFVNPGSSYQELESLVVDAEDILQRLELCYRVVELCTSDLSFAAAKCYDIELWAPGQERWLEVSSCSNFEDFQARRANIRFRDENGKKSFVHTLNGSGVALPRLIVAILENFQQADGSVVIPEAIRHYMDGQQRIR
jgi:seryl-tRNA synthetase